MYKVIAPPDNQTIGRIAAFTPVALGGGGGASGGLGALRIEVPVAVREAVERGRGTIEGNVLAAKVKKFCILLMR
jgi:hypothetical protein